jgi:hypothetical protein
MTAARYSSTDLSGVFCPSGHHKAIKAEELESTVTDAFLQSVGHLEVVETPVTDDIRRELAKTYGIPAALAGRLVGETREELEKDALELSLAFPKEPEFLTGGLDPEGEYDDEDPVEHYFRHRAASRAYYGA